jgi:hypothetical protein
VRGVLDPGVPYSLFLVDSFDLTYERLYRAVNNALLCRGDDNPTVTISGFSGSDILLFDITNSVNPKIVQSTTITREDTYSLSFQPASPEAVYLAVLREAANGVTKVSASALTQLRKKSKKADYLIITTPELEAASTSLANYRKKQGLTPKVVLIEEIMNEFNDGIYDPRAIRSFLTFAYQNWVKPPKYVILAGNGTYDYKDHLGHGDNLIPTLMVETTMGLSASDNLFAKLEGDPVPKIAVGRLPVLTGEELQDIVDKIRFYEIEKKHRITQCGKTFFEAAGSDERFSSVPAHHDDSFCGPPIQPGKRALLLADDPDGGGNFPEDSDDLSHWLDQAFTVEKIYLSETPLEEAQQRLLDSINRGTVFLNYIGHGGPDRLASEGLLTKGNLSSMNNLRGLHVLTAMTCLVGQFAIPGYDSLSESLVLKKDGGSAALWAPTGYSFNTMAKILGEEFFKAAFDRPGKAIGDAILEAFEEYHRRGAQAYMMDIYTLLGDPAMRLK